MKKLVIAGGTGYLGSILTHYFYPHFNEVVILTRKLNSQKEKVKFIHWDGETIDNWKNELSNADVIINLSGKSINCRHTVNNKKEILSSRLNATNAIGKAIQELEHPPKVWINISANAIYKNSYNEINTEESFKEGFGFMYETCKEWENAFNKYDLANTRKIILRLPMVIGNSGGAFPVLKTLCKFGLGGKAGNGEQMVSWVHEQDFCRLCEWIINNHNAIGIYNGTSPNPISNQNMMEVIRKKCGLSFGLCAPEFIVKIGAYLIGTNSDLILDSVNVVSKRAIDQGFEFEYDDFEHCIADIINN